MKNYIEIMFWKLAKWLLIRAYECRCKKEDFDENCMECRAGQAIKFIDEHIDLV